jgi:hypothetical protein
MGELARTTVTVIEPDRMNVLGLMLASVLERRLDSERGARTLRKLCGTVVIDSNGMRVALVFDRRSVAIRRSAPAGRVRAQIRGTLMALLDAALGRRLVHHLLTGRLRARGGPFVLWHVLRLLHA